MVALYITLIAVGMLSSRVTSIGARGGVVDNAFFKSAVGLAAVAATFSLLGGGFFVLKWYWPTLGFIFGSAIAAFAVNRRSLAVLLLSKILMDIFIVVGSVYFWFLVFKIV
jgi:hypothetical protein